MASENGFATHDAHDALGDVEATICIARRIAEGDRSLWLEMLENRYKRRVQAKLETFQPMELVLRFGEGPPRSCLGCFCGYATGNATQAAFFDFEAGDLAMLMQADDAELFAAVDGTAGVVRSLSTNRAPAVFAVRDPTREQLLESRRIAERPDFRRRVCKAVAARFVRKGNAPAQAVEEQIYGGFYSDVDRDLLVEFQRSDWPRRREIVGMLTDPRLRELGRRLIAVHSPDLLAEIERIQFLTFLRKRWNTADVPGTKWTTIEGARRELRDLRENAGVDPAALGVISEFIEDLVR